MCLYFSGMRGMGSGPYYLSMFYSLFVCLNTRTQVSHTQWTTTQILMWCIYSFLCTILIYDYMGKNDTGTQQFFYTDIWKICFLIYRHEILEIFLNIDRVIVSLVLLLKVNTEPNVFA